MDTASAVEHLSRRMVLRLSAGSLVVFAALTWVFMAVQRRPFESLFWSAGPLSRALALGLFAGVTLALAVTAAVIYAPGLGLFRAFLRAAYAKVEPRVADMLIVSVNAGVGEELFFRGALQPLLGLGWTAVVFALLHSGVPSSRGLAAFGLYTFAMALLLGVFYERAGLAAAMAAHAAFDFVFLAWSARALLPRTPLPHAASGEGR